MSLLTACGGGGGGSDNGGGAPNPAPPPPPPPPPPLALLQITPSGYADPVGLGFALVETVISFGVNSAIAFDARASQPNAAPVNEACLQSGTSTIALTDNDSSGTLTTGDRVVLTFNVCDNGGGATSGRLDIDVLSITAVGSEDRVRMRTTLANFAIAIPGGTLAMSGVIECEWRASLDSDRFLVSGSQFAVSFGGATDRLRDFTVEYAQNYAFYEFLMSMSGRVESGTLNGIFDILTDAPYAGRLGDFPTVGAVTFRGAGNSAVRLEESGNAESFSLEVGVIGDFDGDGIFTPAGVTLPWVTVTDISFFDAIRVVPEPPENPSGELRGRNVDLVVGPTISAIGDMAVDDTRGRAYVSLQHRNEVAVLSTATWQVVGRIGVGSEPWGIDIAQDGSALFVALSSGGGIARLDLETGQVTRIETAGANNTSRVGYVTAADNRLYVAPRFLDANALSFLVEVDRGNGNAVRRLPEPPRALQAEMVASADGRFLYLSQTPPGLNDERLYKIDLSLPDTPIVVTRDFGDPFQDISQLALSPDGTRLVARSGEVLRTSDFAQIGKLPSGQAHAFSADGTRIGSMSGNGFMLFSATSLVTLRNMTLDCPGGVTARLAHVPSSDEWVKTTALGVCAFDVNDPLNPPGQPGGPPLPTIPQPIPLAVTEIAGIGGLRTAHDPESGRLYIASSEGATAQLIVFSLADSILVASVPVPTGVLPTSLSLNDDGSRLYLGHGASGVSHIDVFDTATRTFLAPVPYPASLMDNLPGAEPGAVSDVAWIGNDRLLLSPIGNRASGAALSMLNVENGEGAQIANGQKKFNGDAAFRVTPDLTAALVAGNNGAPRLQRIDLTLDDPDLVADRDSPELSDTDRASFSLDGEVLYIRGGKAVNARTLWLVGMTAEGFAMPTPDGSTLYVLESGGGSDIELRVFDPVTFQMRAIYILPSCGLGGSVAAMLTPDPREIVYVKGASLCRVTVPE